MKNVNPAIIIISCFIAFGTALAQEPVRWAEFESKEGQFRVDFPSKPQTSVAEGYQPSGKRPIYWFQVLSNSYFFAVNYSDYSGPSAKNSDLKKIYDFMEKQLVETFEGRLISSREIIVNNLQGREIMLEKIGERQVVRHFVVGSRLYWNVIIMRVADFERSEMAAMSSKFFESFEVTKSDKK